MISGPKTPDLDRMFIVALLLTRKMQQAEAVVIRSIQSLDPDASDELTRYAGIIKAAAADGIPLTEHAAIDVPSSCPNFAEELKNVMHLPPKLRYCFVARVLSGLSQDVCAELLSLMPHEVVAYTRAAISALSLAQTNVASVPSLDHGSQVRASIAIV